MYGVMWGVVDMWMVALPIGTCWVLCGSTRVIHPCDPPVLSLRPFLRIVSVVQFRKRRELIDFFLLPPGLPPVPGAGGS